MFYKKTNQIYVKGNLYSIRRQNDQTNGLDIKTCYRIKKLKLVLIIRPVGT